MPNTWGVLEEEQTVSVIVVNIGLTQFGITRTKLFVPNNGHVPCALGYTPLPLRCTAGSRYIVAVTKEQRRRRPAVINSIWNDRSECIFNGCVKSTSSQVVMSSRGFVVGQSVER